MLRKATTIQRFFNSKLDYYKILRLPQGFTAKELKDSYKYLTKTFHPDRNPDKNARMIFEQIQEAYTVLSDSNKKDAYDRLGLTLKEQIDFQQGDFDSASFKQFWEYKGGYYNNHQMFQDILQYFSINQKYFRGKQIKQHPGDDAYVKLSIGFFENYQKSIKKIIKYKVR